MNASTEELDRLVKLEELAEISPSQKTKLKKTQYTSEPSCKGVRAWHIK